MYIIYASMLLYGYWVGMMLFRVDWEKKEVLPDIKRSNSPLIGKNKNGKVCHDFKKYAHMIVAGTTGYGKTNFIKTLISQLNGDIYLIDLKGGHDYGRVSATEIKEARNVLEHVVGIMRHRRNEHIYVIVDEAGELLPRAHLTKKENADYYACLAAISEIARLGRGFHVHLIYATQYPTADILNGQVKQNAESRIVFRLPTEVGSRVALDEMGAEELPSGVVGRAIYRRDIELELQTYEFIERENWDEKVRDKEVAGNGDHTIIE